MMELDQREGRKKRAIDLIDALKQDVSKELDTRGPKLKILKEGHLYRSYVRYDVPRRQWTDLIQKDETH